LSEAQPAPARNKRRSEEGVAKRHKGPLEENPREQVKCLVLSRKSHQEIAEKFQDSLLKVAEELAEATEDWRVRLPEGENRVPRPEVTRHELFHIGQTEKIQGLALRIPYLAYKVLHHRREALEAHCLIPAAERAGGPRTAPAEFERWE